MDEWDGASEIADVNETGVGDNDIPDNLDIKTFRYTNDNDNFYFLIETWDSPPSLDPAQYIEICLDTDGDPSTTIHEDRVSQRNRCADVIGIDTVVNVRDLGVFIVSIYDVTAPGTGAVIKGNGTGALDRVAATSVIEVSISLEDLGIDLQDCDDLEIAMVVFYDGASDFRDDKLPDTGAETITCTSTPTAVSMHSASTVVNSPVSSSALLVGLVLTIVSGGVILRRERRA